MNLILLFVIFIITFYLFKNNDRKFKINSKIPGPRGIPLFGNLISMKDNVHLKLEEWYKKYGTIYRIRMGSIETVVITEYPILKKAFIDNSDSFTSRFQYASRIQVNGGQDLAQENGFRHSVLKKVVLSEMTTTRIKKMEHHINKECEKLITLFDKHADDGKPFPINNYFSMFSMNIVLRFLFGVDYPYNQVEDSKGMIYAIKKVFSVAGTPIIGDFIPLFKSKSNPFANEYVDLLNETEILIKKYIENQKLNEISTDELQEQSILYKLIKEFEQGNITWDGVVNTCIDVIAAGSDTSSNTLIFCLIELVNNFEIQNKLFKNISNSITDLENKEKQLQQQQPDECANKCGSLKVINHSKYRSLIPYLSMVISETFRKYPAAPLGLPHLLTQDTEIEGYTIAAGTQIIQNIYATHRSEKIYTSPNEFIPERFIDINNNNSLIHFGIGVRNCVGKSLAECEIFTILATLISRYEFINPDGDQTNKPLSENARFGLALEPSTTNLIIKKRI